MKIIKYNFLSAEINRGTEVEPKIEKVFLNKSMPWSEANEEIAKCEAYKGEYTIEDDGKPEQESVATADDVLNAMLGVM
jgi:CRISPR/Cas system-associated endonuclease/helicase Cas3